MPFLLPFLIVLLFWHSIQVEGGCQKIHTLMYCLNVIPTAEDIRNAAGVTNAIILHFSGTLKPETSPDTKAYSISTIQIQKSRIDDIEEDFFAKHFGDKISEIRLNTNNGTLHLDRKTLSGLKEALKVLHVSDYPVDNTSYLHRLTSLRSLVLVRVGLTSPPVNFPQLLERLTKVDLSYNHLTTLPWDVIAKRLKSGGLNDIRLSGNNWICDCSMLPIVNLPLEHKEKIINFHCVNPPELTSFPWGSLKADDICPGGIDHTPQPPVSPPSEQSVLQNVKVDKSLVKTPDGEPKRLDHADVAPSEEEEPQIATAGGVSTEVIAVIVAVVFVVVLVLVAVIVFRVRSKKQKQRQQAAQKQPSHKSSAYCHVIEHPSTKSGASSRAPGTAAYGREVDHSERQPLAPSYYVNQDNRL